MVTTHSASKHRKRCSRRIRLPGLVWRLKPLHIKRSFETIILFSRLKINSWGCFYGAGQVDSDFSQMESKFSGQTQATCPRNNGKRHDCLSLPDADIHYWDRWWTYNTMPSLQARLLVKAVPFKQPSDHSSIKKAMYICMGVYVYVHVHVSDVCDWKSPLFLDLDICIIVFIRFFTFFCFFLNPL